MAVPISQMWTVATYVLKQKVKGRKQYPLVLMLEPLFRCNLACAGCGKIQYPSHVLKAQLTPEECFRAVEECGAPTVAIPGGEPLLHPQIGEIVEGLVARKKYIYLCTNALLLKQKIDLFKPSKYLSFSVHMDGQREHHDFSVCLEGGYEKAVEGIREAFSGVLLRKSTRSESLSGTRPHPLAISVYSVQPEGGLAVQYVAAVSRVPDGQARLRMYPVGDADFQYFRLAKTLLPASGRLRRYFCRAAGNDGMGAIRHGIRKSQVCELHGSQRLRSVRCQRYLRLAAGLVANGARNAFQQLHGPIGSRFARGAGAPGACL